MRKYPSAKLWREFERVVPEWRVEAERDRVGDKQVLWYHLTCYALYLPKGYELVGRKLTALLERSIFDATLIYQSCEKDGKVRSIKETIDEIVASWPPGWEEVDD